MNYYDELDLPRSASSEEIRQAYKKVARLLHPDQHTDEQLRKMAELQMTRLNEILETLSDPGRRNRYDASITDNPREPAVAASSKLRLNPATTIWVGVTVAAVVVFGLLLLNVEHKPPAMPAATPVPLPAVERPRTIETRTARRTTLDARPTEAIADHLERPHARSAIGSAPFLPNEPGPGKVSDAVIPLAALAKPSTAPSLPIAPTTELASSEPPRMSLIGTWLYTKTGNTKALAYPPEYIEMNIKQGANGRISGRYRGQFRIPDQALSSEILFQFDGPSADAPAEFAWRADDGANGQIRLKFLSPSSLEVSWYTTTFGAARKLASGNAVLYRN